MREAKRLPQEDDTEYAIPKLKLDWDTMKPKRRSGKWSILKTVYGEWTTEGAIKSNETYVYARCECGNVVYLPDGLTKKKHLDCGECGEFGEQEKTEVRTLAPRENPNAQVRKVKFGANGGVIGRPATYKEPTKLVSMHVPAELWDWIGQHSWEIHSSRSGLVVNLLKQYREQMIEMGAVAKQ